MTLKNWKDAFQKFQLLVFKYPNNYNYLYNFCTYLHEYVKAIFKLTKRESTQIETSEKYLKTAIKVFLELDKRLNESIVNTYSFPDTWSEEKKKRILAQNQKLKKWVYDNIFYIRSNEAKYNERMKQDLNRFEEENISKEERRRIIDEQRYKKLQEEAELKRKQQDEERELERRAEVENRIATELLEAVKISKQQIGLKKKPAKRKNELIEDERGNIALQNFGNGDHDDQEKTFQDIELVKRAAPKMRKLVKGKTGEKKRLVKSKAKEPEQEDSDEMLDIVQGSEEGSDSEEEMPAKKRRYNPQGNDDDDSDIGERLQKMDEEPLDKQEIDFGGQDENENTL
jgi:hypothetical protein